MSQVPVSIVLCLVVSISMSRTKCQQQELLIRENVLDLGLHIVRHLDGTQSAAKLKYYFDLVIILMENIILLNHYR
jgi:hypothetical protein